MSVLEQQYAVDTIGTSSVRTSQTGIEMLEPLYAFRERASVFRFIEKYPFLSLLLREAYDKLRNYFPHSHLFLEVVTDPESINGGQLAIFIATQFASDKAIDRLDQFDADWWLDALDRAQGKLCIDVEFQ